MLKCSVDDVQTRAKNGDMWSLLSAQSTRMHNLKTVEPKLRNEDEVTDVLIRMSGQTWHVSLLIPR